MSNSLVTIRHSTLTALIQAVIAVIESMGDRQTLSMDADAAEAIRLCRIAHAASLEEGGLK